MSLQAEIKKQFSGFCLEVSLQTEQGIMGILGASGSGKSMTLKCIAGIETPDTGRIILNGRTLFDSQKRINLPPQKRRVGYLFQNYALFPNMTVTANIAAGIKGSRTEKKAAVEKMTELFRLKGLERRYPSQLSGGQMQRVAIARCLAIDPKFIMLDEPFSALDDYLKEELQLEVKKVLDAYRGDVLFVTHSRDEIYRFCGSCVILNQGRAECFGSAREMFQHPRSVTAARLTGCKNISPAKKLGPRRIEALDWKIALNTAEEVGDEVEFVGIHARHLSISAYAQPEGVPRENGPENQFLCRYQGALSRPFETDILLEPVSGSAQKPLWCSIAPDHLKRLPGLTQGALAALSIRPGDILLLKA